MGKWQQTNRRAEKGWLLEADLCNVQLADEILLISIISPILILHAHAPILSNFVYIKHTH